MQNPNYLTRDFYLAAYLVASGIQLRSSFKHKGLTSFVFFDTNQLQQLVRQFYGLDALINPVTYGNALRNLKSVIHADTNTNEPYVKQSITTN
jgi:hypothetical protein